jgi:small subunit ribosomal protein S8
MSMSDPIADFLTRIRNGIMSRKATVECPRSHLKLQIASILQQEGFIDGVSEHSGEHQGVIEVALRWHDTQNAISGLRRASRPGQRIYVKAKAVPKVRNGLGIAIISTSSGVMSDREARKRGVGGELLCEVW